jgi:hypothetical protein
MYAGRFILYYCLSITNFNILGISLDVLLAQTLMKMLVVGSTLVSKLESCFIQPRTRASTSMYSMRFHLPGMMAVQKL